MKRVDFFLVLGGRVLTLSEKKWRLERLNARKLYNIAFLLYKTFNIYKNDTCHVHICKYLETEIHVIVCYATYFYNVVMAFVKIIHVIKKKR